MQRSMGSMIHLWQVKRNIGSPLPSLAIPPNVTTPKQVCNTMPSDAGNLDLIYFKVAVCACTLASVPLLQMNRTWFLLTFKGLWVQTEVDWVLSQNSNNRTNERAVPCCGCGTPFRTGCEVRDREICIKLRIRRYHYYTYATIDFARLGSYCRTMYAELKFRLHVFVYILSWYTNKYIYWEMYRAL